jgi:diacylglycerol kinase family enzyme
LGKKIYFILNSNARSGNVSQIIRSLSKGFPLYSFNVLLSSATKVAGDFTRELLSPDSLFIVIGGDGTINNAVQYLVNTPATFGVIPKGTANDLANAFDVPLDIQGALHVISGGSVRKIDTIKVNANHLLTVGSIGFPSTIAESVNQFKAGGAFQKFLHRWILGSAIYKIFAFLLLVFKGERAAKHRGQIFVNGEKFFEGAFAAVFFGKQEVLGKSFRPCPDVSAADPYLCVSVLQYKGLWSLFKDMLALGSTRKPVVKNLLCAKAESFEIYCDSFQHLLGDGEILDFDDTFIGKRIPQALNFLVPSQGGKS